MNSTFLNAWVAGINDPSSWDAAGASFTGLGTYLSGLAELQGKAAQGALSAVELPRFISSYDAWYQALAKVNAQMASQAGSLTDAELQTLTALRQQENRLKFLVDQLKQSGVTTANVKLAGTALGAFVGVAQIVSEVGTGSWDDVGKVTAGVMAGYWAGAALANGIVATGLATGPVGWLVTAAFVAGVSFGASKGAEAAWMSMISSDAQSLRRALLDQAKTIFGDGSPMYEQIRSQLQHSADKLGKLDGTWLEGFTDMVPGDKAYLTFLMFSPAGARFTDAYWRDLDDLFSIEFAQGQLPVRDAAFAALSQISALSPAYTSQRVQMEEGGALRH